jgi:hypothetical protein
MPTPLLNIETGYYEDVPDSDIISSVESGKYAAPKTVTATFGKHGESTVSYNDYKNKWSKQEHVVTPTSELSRRQGEAYLKSKYDRGLTDQLITGVEQFADTLLLGIPGRTFFDSEGFHERQKRNRTGAMIGQVAGVAVPIAADIVTAGAATPLVASSIAKVGAKGLAEAGAKSAVRTGAKDLAMSAIRNAPINIVNRTARLAGETLIPAAETAGKRIAKSAVVGAAEGAGLEVAHQGTGEALDFLLNEDQNTIDGHAILGNALFGGAVGGGFSALSEGLSAAGNKISRFRKGITSADTAVAEDTIIPKVLSKEDIAASSKLKRSASDVELGPDDINIKNTFSRTTTKEISTLERDLKQLEKEIARNRNTVADTRASWKNVEGYDADEIVMNMDEALNSIGRLKGPNGLLMKISSGKVKMSDLHDLQNDLTTSRNTGMLMEAAGMKVPKTLGKGHTEQIASMMRKEGIDSSVFNSKFLSDEDVSKALSLGLITQPSLKSIAEALEQSGRLQKVIDYAKHVPGVGKFASTAEKLIDPRTAATLGLGSIITGGVGGLAAAAPVAAGGAVVAGAAYGLGKGLIAMYRNPSTGGLLTSSVADTLKRSVIAPGDNPSRNGSDEDLLRQFANELRQANENDLIRSTIQTLGPLTPQSTIDAVIRRKNYLDSVLNKEIPRSSDPVSAIIDKPRIKPGATRRVSEAIKGSSHPYYFLLAADAGKLTKEAMKAAEVTFPEAVSLIRTHIAAKLAASLNGQGLDPRARARVKVILGAQDSGSYSQLMKKLTSGGQSVSGQQYQMPDPSKSIKLNSAKNYQDPLTSATFKMI